MTTNDKLREALAIGIDAALSVVAMPTAIDSRWVEVKDECRAALAAMREALAASKQKPQAQPASEADMKVYGGIASNYFKDVSNPEPQAQAGEPEVHVTMDDAIAAGDGTLHGAIEYWQNRCAKKDAALDACVEALDEAKTYTSSPSWSPSMTEDIEAAITKAKEARQ